MSPKFTLSLPAWVSALCGRPTSDVSYWRFIARKQVRHYVSHNLSEFAVHDNRACLVRGAVLNVARVRSAFDSARDAFRAEYAISRALSPHSSGSTAFRVGSVFHGI